MNGEQSLQKTTAGFNPQDAYSGSAPAAGAMMSDEDLVMGYASNLTKIKTALSSSFDDAPPAQEEGDALSGDIENAQMSAEDYNKTISPAPSNIQSDEAYEEQITPPSQSADAYEESYYPQNSYQPDEAEFANNANVDFDDEENKTEDVIRDALIGVNMAVLTN